MDLVTQGVLGAALSQASAKRPQIRLAGFCGFLAGMAADLDVLIRSSSDPLMFLEYHRHFTHALAFIPVGGFLSALVVYALIRKRGGLTFAETFLYCTLGYATHALLDACTTYGTSLLWPFSAARVAWNVVAVVDPLVTVPLTVLILVSLFKRNPVYARAALAWVVLYLGAGAWQHSRALDTAREIAAARGHAPTRVEAKPSFANILVWRTIYDTPDSFYVDAVRTGIVAKVFEGTFAPKLDTARDLPWLSPDSQQAKDIERFRFFSDGFIARDPAHDNRIIDIRYSFAPNDIRALWSIELSPDAPPEAHARYLTHRAQARESLALLWRMIWLRGA
ncbi:MAG: metal-dependent hydrolase [Rhodospirillaceae bacterium]|nr:metal-dependent hydrolase [Rhodospirillaceae bacterium]